MAVANDASTPVRWTGVPADTVNITSASFTAPTNSQLVVCVSAETNDVDVTLTIVVDDSGGLTWTTRVEEQRGGDGGTFWIGYTGIFTSSKTTSSVSRTVNVRRNNSTAGANRISAFCYVLTGADVDGTPIDSVSAANEGSSASSNLTTTSVTPGATGLLVVAATDSPSASAFAASTDLTQDVGWYPDEISTVSGYKVCTSGVGVTGNVNAGGAGAAYVKWCQIVVRESTVPPATAVLTGTALSGMTEADIVTGGKVITITLTNGTWIPS